MAALRAASVLAGVATAAAHGAMVSPAPRNAIDTELPRWSHGKKTPRTGVIEPLEVGCANGTDACAIGQSVFWFSQGCSPGCRACDGNGTRFANWGEYSSCVRLPHTLIEALRRPLPGRAHGAVQVEAPGGVPHRQPQHQARLPRRRLEVSAVAQSGQGSGLR